MHFATCFKKHLKDKIVFYLESGGCYSIKQLHGAAYAGSKWSWLLIREDASEKSWGWLSLQVVSWLDPHIVVSILVHETGFVCVSREHKTLQAQFTQVKSTRDFWETRVHFFFFNFQRRTCLSRLRYLCLYWGTSLPWRTENQSHPSILPGEFWIREKDVGYGREDYLSGTEASTHPGSSVSSLISFGSGGILSLSL